MYMHLCLQIENNKKLKMRYTDITKYLTTMRIKKATYIKLNLLSAIMS